MNSSEMESLLRKILATIEKGVRLNWKDIRVYLIVAIASGIASLLGSWANAYLSTRGEIAAIKESLREITEAQEQIKARVSGELWIDQNIWNLKRETYWKLTSTFSQLSSAIWDIQTKGFLPDKKILNPDPAVGLPLTEKLGKLFNEQISLTAPSFIVLCPEAVAVLNTLHRQNVEINEHLVGGVVTYDYFVSLKKAIDDAYNQIIKIAKQDLRRYVETEGH